MSDKTTNETWVELQTARDAKQGDKTTQVRLVLCKWNGAKAEYFSGESNAFTGLEANGYIWPEFAPPREMRLSYRGHYEVTLATAELMVKTLRTLERKLERAQETDGEPKSLSQWVLRFARAAGAEGVLYTKDGKLWPSTNRYAVDAIDRIVEKEHDWTKGKDETA